jgi:hypothetical protein
VTGFIVLKASEYLKNQASNDLLSLTRVGFLEPGAAEGGCDVGAEGGDVATGPSPDETEAEADCSDFGNCNDSGDFGDFGNCNDSAEPVPLLDIGFWVWAPEATIRANG